MRQPGGSSKFAAPDVSGAASCVGLFMQSLLICYVCVRTLILDTLPL
jgi:hypothetical protein